MWTTGKYHAEWHREILQRQHSGMLGPQPSLRVCVCLCVCVFMQRKASEWCAPCWAADWDPLCQVWFLAKHEHTCSVYSIQVEGRMEGMREGWREGGAPCRPALRHSHPCLWLHSSWSTCTFGKRHDFASWEENSATCWPREEMDVFYCHV